LLSFAQFEREVTGERIRDKFAAAKKKGIWMGGTPPLGYDVENRKLIVNDEEAKTVRMIFGRYLEVDGVRALQEELRRRQIVSKSWTSRTGRVHKGYDFSRGSLYHLLKNRVYLGETTHKGASYQGEHEAIVPADLFDAVQKKIAELRRCALGKPRAEHGALLAGILFDELGRPMTPSYSVNPRGRKYRYYISRSDSAGAANQSLTRISAPALEQFLFDALTRLQLCDCCNGTSPKGMLKRVDVTKGGRSSFDRRPCV